MKETRIAFSGTLKGTARIQTGGGHTLIRVHTTQGALPEGSIAWLCGDALLRLPLAEGVGDVKEEAAWQGLLLTQGGRVLGAGGFAGREAALREAALRVRLREQPQQSRPAPASANPPPPPPQETKPTQQGSPALQNILRMAEMLFPPQQIPEAKPAEETAQPAVLPYIPFPQAYPGVVFQKVAYPGSERYYLEATIQKGAERFVLHAMQGSFSPVPPVPGFTRFLRAGDGTGYWVRERLRKE